MHPTTLTSLTLKTAIRSTVLLSVLTISACGSDDKITQTQPTDNSPPALENVAPVANAGINQTVMEQSQVTLNGANSSDSDGTLAHFLWLQTQGTPVDLSDVSVTSPTFNAPNISEDETLIFELTVTDNNGATHANVVSIHVTHFLANLNDTGLTLGGNYPSGNNMTCMGETAEQQDCFQGRDASNLDNSDGHAGFSFTKLDNSGNTLDAAASSWQCVKDNVSGLIWEVKTTDGGLHDHNTSYRWGGVGAQQWGTQFYEDWNSLLNGSNQEQLCGFNDWRVPTITELEGLVSFDRTAPTIDTDYFPNTVLAGYLSINANSSDESVAWYVHFNGGWTHSNALRDNSDPSRLKYVRLVRDGI